MSGLTYEEFTTYSALDVAATGIVVKSSAGTLGGLTLHNTSAGARYVKLYNKASAATSGDTPKLRFHLAAGASLSVSLPGGVPFAAGIGVRAVTGAADNDNTGATTNDVLINLFYK